MNEWSKKSSTYPFPRYKIASREFQHTNYKEGDDEDEEEDNEDLKLFEVDDKGRLIVSGHLDREEKASHRITIMAETDASPSLSAYYDLTVKILDENDNAPTFSSDLYEVTVSEAVAPHTQLVQVLATDPDLGNNGEVSYSFGERSKRLARLFSIDPNTGWISTQVINALEIVKHI